jgi:HlyD family secretion protein
MRKFFTGHKLLLVLIIGVSAAVFAFGLRRARGVTVDVMPVRPQPLEQTILASGRVMSPARVEIGSVITGRIAQVLVREGDQVEAGQVLIELETHELSAALRQAEASEHYARTRLATVAEVGLVTAEKTLAQAQTTLAWTERELQRARPLFAEGIMSQAKFEDLERAHQIAKSQHESARTQMDSQTNTGAQSREAAARLSEATAARELAAAKLAQASLRASEASTVLTRQVEPGDIVQPGKTLLTLATIGETRISAEIDEKNLPYLKVGNTALASADAFPDTTFPAELYYLAPGIDVERGTVEARFRIPTPPAFLRADMTLSVEIKGTQKTQAFVLPFDAVRGSSTGTPTILTVHDGKVISRPVTVGLKAGNTVEIVHGIHDGEQVIVSAAIAPGTAVRPRIVNASSPVENAS